MNYDDWKLMTPEQDNPRRQCDRCENEADVDDMEFIDGDLLCPDCIEILKSNAI